MDERGPDPHDEGASEQAEDMEDRAEQMEQRSDELEREIDRASSDWESKKHDQSVPGAQPEEGESDRRAEGGGGDRSEE